MKKIWAERKYVSYRMTEIRSVILRNMEYAVIDIRALVAFREIVRLLKIFCFYPISISRRLEEGR